MAIATPQCESVRRLIDALGLRYVRSLRLSMGVNNVATIVTEQFVTGDQLGRLAGEFETKEWVLVPRDEWERANLANGRDG